MIKILTTLFLMLASCHCSAVEMLISNSDETEMIEEEAIEQNGIDNLRDVVKFYGEATADEKNSYLLETGLTEQVFNCLVALSKLDWKTKGKHSLPQSNSTISIPSGFALVTGRDAIAVNTIEGKPADEFLEAYVCDNTNFDNSVLFQYMKTGYISIDNCKEINPKELLREISKKTEEDNIERRNRGSNELHVIGWIQEPTFDKTTNTVYWAIEGNSGEEENIVNSIAIRLGREGYEKINWIATKSSYIPFGGHLDIMLRAHSFDPGYRYSDYRSGDKVAGYGIATLVAATLGGKVVKASGFIIFFKKIGSFLFAGIAGLFYKFRNLFKRSDNA